MSYSAKNILRSSVGMAAIIAAVIWVAGTGRAQDRQASNPFAPLHFRFIGPLGGRTSAIAGVPGDPAVAYVGNADGGIFKTSDYATTWQPIFDDQQVASIGALAVAPSAPNIVWAGTGEPWIIRADIGMGDGIYKSTDAGRNWRHMGLEQTGHITQIVIDPQNPDIVYACAVGQTYRPQRERGIFKTTDGGATWQQSLFVDENTGCSDLAMNPGDPNTLVAGMWQVTIHTWNLDSGGPGGGVYITHDGGASWKRMAGNGLPTAGHPVGRVGVAIAPTNSQRVYALIEDNPPGFYSSDDGGRHWRLVNRSFDLGGRFPYDARFGVSSANENVLYFLGKGWNVSQDGGETVVPHPASAGSDLHNIWVDPKDPNHFMVSEDSGGTITWNGGKTYRQIILPNSQIYHAFTDNRVPYHVYGNKQDGGSLTGPSNSLSGRGGIAIGDWSTADDCESGWLVPDPQDDDLAWATCYDGDVGRLNLRTGQSREVGPWPDSTFGWTPAAAKYRWNWTTPIAISPHDHNKIYVGGQYVMMTTNGGQTWQTISPDLTLDDKSHEQNAGGVTVYNLFTFEGETIFDIAESPVQAGVIWAGTSDGQVQFTRDNGAHWTNVTKNLPNLPPWGTVENIEPSHFAAGTAYAAVSLQQMGDYSPYVFKTSDFGQTWQNIGGGVPKSVFSFPLCVIEDPVRKGMLYLGTSNALYISWDDGDDWTQLRNNLPPGPVKWLNIQKNYNDLVISTYGRGFWILDDVTPLRDWDKAQHEDVHLFKPRPAYRYRYIDMVRSVVRGMERSGDNPPDGADINFYLRASSDDAKVTIRDASGEAVRTLKVKGRAGLNRAWWNLEYDPVHVIRLRTPSPNGPWVQVGPDGWRPYVSSIRYQGGPRVAPGTYTVQLSANGKQLSEPITVLRDPNDIATTQMIRADVAFSRQVLAALNQTIDMINQLEWDRKQAEDLASVLAQRPNASATLASVKELDAKAIDIEKDLFEVESTGTSTVEKNNHAARLYEKLVNMMELADHQLCCGGGAGSSAGLEPTDAEQAVVKLYQQQLAQEQERFRAFTSKDVPALNSALKVAHLQAGIDP
ncbi:MAG TPA: hypothetical protein VGS20_08185 [Candidatus Acidoferrales bacterium]|nr:hypothetical protein [Candidatus Acidoferrales bacterium]